MEATILKKGQRTCPKCNSNWDGGSIIDALIEQRNAGSKYFEGKTDEQIKEHVMATYAPPYIWRREIGIELMYDHPQYYDGISYWQCPDCKTTFNRFTGVEEKIE